MVGLGETDGRGVVLFYLLGVQYSGGILMPSMAMVVWR